MYVGLYAIYVWNWDWKLTQDHSLIKHWSQRTLRCSIIQLMTGELRPQYSALQLLGESGACGYHWVYKEPLPLTLAAIFQDGHHGLSWNTVFAFKWK